MALTEEQLVGVWIVDPIKKTRLAAAIWHFEKHKAALEATTLEQYVRQAIAFREEAKRRNGSGKPVVGKTLGVRSWTKLGKFIHLAPSNEIVSFGAVNYD